MLRTKKDLIEARRLHLNTQCYSQIIKDDNDRFIRELIQDNGVLPKETPFELHPYKNEVQLQNFEKYIIGTFPPISYILDYPEIIKANINILQQPNGGNNITPPDITFFHGNMGSMWNYLLTPEENNRLWNLSRTERKYYIIDILTNNKINYADIIDSAQRQLKEDKYTASDDFLHNICPNMDLICHILSNDNPNKYLLFNTASIFGTEGMHINRQMKAKSFDIFVRQCILSGLLLEFKFQGDQNYIKINNLPKDNKKNKTSFSLKIINPAGNKKLNCDLPETEKIVTVITPFSPAAVDRGNTKKNRVVKNWLKDKPNASPEQLLKEIYQNFRNSNWDAIYDLNQ